MSQRGHISEMAPLDERGDLTADERELLEELAAEFPGSILREAS